MKFNSTFSLLLALFFTANATAGNGYSPQQLKSCLINVNAEWQHQPESNSIVADNSIQLQETFNGWIATHLMLVEKTLRQRDNSTLTSTQKNNRFHLLDELNGYWRKGVFPENDYLTYKNPVFIDRKGTHCAVGYLMMQSGNDDLAKRIDANEKFAYVHNIKTEGVKAWADEHGFTVDELAWIQPGYPPTTPVLDLDSGLNGTVLSIVPDVVNGTIYAGGTFTATTGGTTCSHVAAWISGFAGWDWIPVGDGLNGTVRTLLLYNNKLYAGGDFTQAGNVAAKNIAVYDVALGQWQALGSLDSTVNALAFYNGELYAGGKFNGLVSKWTGTTWQNITQGFIDGEGVRALEVWDGVLVIGGNFDLATGALRKNVASYNGSYMGILGFGTVTPVNDFELYAGELYAACDVVSGTDTCAIASYKNGDWTSRLKPDYGFTSYFEGTSINSMKVINGVLVAGGSFSSGSGMTYGSNLMALELTPSGWGDTTQLMCLPLTLTDNTVHSVASLNSTVYFGGSFITSMNNTLNHIGELQLTITGVEEKAAIKNTINISPNPSSDFIQITSPEQNSIIRAEILDVSGRKLNEVSGPTTISTSGLNAGLYLVRALTSKGWATSRFVKE
jgi:hypothetical protein